MTPKRDPLIAHVDPELAVEIKSEAEARGVSTSTYMRQILEQRHQSAVLAVRVLENPADLARALRSYASYGRAALSSAMRDEAETWADRIDGTA